MTENPTDPHSTPDRTTKIVTPRPAKTANRGKRAKDGTGEVEGSGAGAGGGGNPEGFDSDDVDGGTTQ